MLLNLFIAEKVTQTNHRSPKQINPGLPFREHIIIYV
jgi:hypothetical protein